MINEKMVQIKIHKATVAGKKVLKSGREMEVQDCLEVDRNPQTKTVPGFSFIQNNWYIKKKTQIQTDTEPVRWCCGGLDLVLRPNA